MNDSLHSEDRPIIAVVGPTASGKSALGIELAQRIGGEIINCDSVQVYQGIEIATAKVPPSEQQGVPHHLVDFIPPERNYTAGEWARAAVNIIGEIEGRSHSALLVGGTGLYVRALRQPLFNSPPTDQGLRRRLMLLREQHGPVHLHRMLQRLDASSAARLHERDWVRVQRALEVRFQTGQPLSEYHQQSTAQPSSLASRVRIIALLPPRAELYRRIDERTEEHFRCGLVDEVQSLLKRGVSADSSALGAHGYRRVVEFLQGKRDNLASAIEQTKLDVRHYAKRQLTWFRRESGVRWFDGFGDDPRVKQQVILYLEQALHGKHDG